MADSGGSAGAAFPIAPMPVALNAVGTTCNVGLPTKTPADLPNVVVVPPTANPTRENSLKAMADSIENPVVKTVAKTLATVVSLPSDIVGAVGDALGSLSSLVEPAKTAALCQNHLDDIARVGECRRVDAVCRANPSWTNDPNFASRESKYVGTAQGAHDSALGSISSSLGSMLSSITGLASSIFNGLTSALNGIVGAITSAISGVVGAITGAVGEILKATIGGFGKVIGGVLGGLGSAFGDHASNITNACSQVSSAVKAESAAFKNVCAQAQSGPSVFVPSNASDTCAKDGAANLLANPAVSSVNAAARAAAGGLSSIVGQLTATANGLIPGGV